MQQLRDGGHETKVKTVEEYIKLLQTKTKVEALKFLEYEVPYARVATTYKKEFRRLEVKVREGTDSAVVWEIMRDTLFLDGPTPLAQRLLGTPPPGDLERRIQEVIDELEGK